MTTPSTRTCAAWRLGVDVVRECVKPRVAAATGAMIIAFSALATVRNRSGLPLWVLEAGVSEDEHPTPRRNSGYVNSRLVSLAFCVRTEA